VKSSSLSCVVLASIAALAGGGCGDNAGGNAPVLWLALDGRETEVRLVDEEPEPF